MSIFQPPGARTRSNPCRFRPILLLPHFFTTATVAAVIEVNPGESIQAAIDASTTQEGDEIVVAPGRYVETIDLRGRALTVRSTDPANPEVVSATILDGGGADSVITARSGEGPDTLVAGFTITGGLASSGGGAYLDTSNPTFLHCTFLDNEAFFDGGGMFCLDAQPLVINCRFLGNRAFFGGGMANILASPGVTNCLFSGNEASSSGGGADNFNQSAPDFTNCTFSANRAGDGGALSNAGASPLLLNCILWDNHSSSGFTDEVFGAGSWFSHCDVAGSGGSNAWDGSLGEDGGGNLDADPMFADADGSDDLAGTADDDLHLLPESPCLDAGNGLDMPLDSADLDDDGDVSERVPLDLDRQPRYADRADVEDSGVGEPPLPDLGVYELQPEPEPCPADLNGDGRVNGRDLLIMLKAAAYNEPGTADLDGDGLITFGDLIRLLHAWGPCDQNRANERDFRYRPDKKENTAKRRHRRNRRGR
jgi:hypothetical protein